MAEHIRCETLKRKRCSEALWTRVAARERIGYEPSHEADSAPF